MSIINRNPNPNSSLVTTASLINPHKTKWNLILFKFPKKISDKIKLEIFLDGLTIKTFSKIFDLSIYIYTSAHEQNKDFYHLLVDKYNAKLVEIPPVLISNSLKLLIIKNFINSRENVICINTGIGYHNEMMSVELENVNSTIFAKIISREIFSGLYQQLANQMNLNQIIDTKILIVPYTEVNQKYIDYAFDIANQFNADDIKITTDISLTIANSALGNKIKDITLSYGTDTLLYINDQATISKLREYYNADNSVLTAGFSQNFARDLNEIYRNNDQYIYYPYLDINTEPEYISISNPNIINTNGFVYSDISTKNIKNIMFKRFDSGDSGIYIRKDDNEVIIPKILHLVQLDLINNTSQWGKILRIPWTLIVWTQEKINSDLLIENNIWTKLYNLEDNPIIKSLIIYFSILEKYGGIVVNSSLSPIKIIPDEILTKKFVISFFDEKKYGTKLSYQVIASVQSGLILNQTKKLGRNEIRTRDVSWQLARIPFEGTNNFFRDVKLQKNKEKNITRNDQITNPIIFEKLIQILSNADKLKRLELIETLLINDPDTYVYPSYYFNPQQYNYPRDLLENSITRDSSRKIINHKNDDAPKTEITRKYKITVPAIIAKLNENPIDRLRNNKTLN